MKQAITSTAQKSANPFFSRALMSGFNASAGYFQDSQNRGPDQNGYEGRKSQPLIQERLIFKHGFIRPLFQRCRTEQLEGIGHDGPFPVQPEFPAGIRDIAEDRKSTRLNSSHSSISY